MKTLFLIDSHALIHRFYHALPPLTASDGTPTNALYGVAATTLKILKENKPDYIAAAFDRPEATFRKEAFKEYKAQRPAAPDDLIPQLQKTREVFDAFKVKTFEIPGYEADDIIGTLVEKFKNDPGMAGGRIIIFSGDNDVLQLVEGQKVLGQIIKTGMSETVLYDEPGVEAKYDGLGPKRLPDYKGLIGDTSDNIPGVKGVGPKTAVTLLKDFGTIEEIFDSLAIINPKISKKLEGQKEIALMSKKLATIKRDVPIEIGALESLKVQPLDREGLMAFFKKYNFSSLINRL
ncbi:MAG: DNA polymerase I [Parcubacteria group bacterium Gr01-1014_3]|nr:MAG: DNA polymerase I [Parcubacteria group bacterium Gr01-1014_3]